MFHWLLSIFLVVVKRSSATRMFLFSKILFSRYKSQETQKCKELEMGVRVPAPPELNQKLLYSFEVILFWLHQYRASLRGVRCWLDFVRLVEQLSPNRYDKSIQETISTLAHSLE